MPDRVEGGLFAPGNRIAVGRAPRRDGLRFAAWCREVLADPDRRARLLEKLDREINTDGAATLLPRVLAYAYGEPKQVVEAEVKVRALALAKLVGVPVEVLLAEAARLSAAAEGENDA